MASTNLDRLVEARVVPSPEALTTAERNVIEGLSEEEVSTLIGIRKKLSGELARQPRLTADADADPEQDIKSNFVI